jgi:hypothetical protein
MCDAAFLVVLRAWLLRRRTDRFLADATRDEKPDRTPRAMRDRGAR